MDPQRKRRLRLFVALGAAVVLASALIYTSFSASTTAKTPSELIGAAEPGRSYELTGRVVADSVDKDGSTLTFRIRDRDGGESLPVDYQGVVPDPFREGREVIVSGELEGGRFVAERDSLITKCPSKFTEEKQSA